MTPEGVDRFFRSVAAALGQCVVEDLECLGPVVVSLACLATVFLAYELIFDPNAVDVANRLDALSINPDKWTLLS